MANEKWRILAGSKRLLIDGIEVSGVTAAILNALSSAGAAGMAFLTGVTAGTAAVSKAMVLSSAGGIGGPWRDTRATPFFKQATPAAKTVTVTLTAAELLNGIITGNQGAAGAAAYTLPLATDLETAIGLQITNADDVCFDFNVINISTNAAEDITITTNTGWTLVGSMLIIEQAAGNPGGSNGRFRVRRTANNLYTLYRIS